jgi:aspartate-semialdehyde dehydrogenase
LISVAVVGATGAVGREILTELERIGSPDIDVVPYASERSAGSVIKFRNRHLHVQPYSVESAGKHKFVLMSAGSSISKSSAEELVKRGATVIDNSSAWRMDPRFPLIVPEVNRELLRTLRGPSILPNGNCSTIQLVVALAPLHKSFGLKAVNVTTFQSVSGAGQKGIDDLKQQNESMVADRPITANHLPRTIAGNLIPAIDKFDEFGHCFEERKIVQETRKILGIPHLMVFASTIRVPTYRGHGESVTVELSQSVTRSDVEKVFNQAESCKFYQATSYESLPDLSACVGNGLVHITRMRLPTDEPRSSNVMFWNFSDNLLKGAATNAVQIFNECLALGVGV